MMGPSIGEMPRPTYRPVTRHRDQVNVCERERIDPSMTLACVLLSESGTGGAYVS
jgi:hypothetical protein